MTYQKLTHHCLWHKSHCLRKSTKIGNFGKWTPQNLLFFGYFVHIINLRNLGNFFWPEMKISGFWALFVNGPITKNEIFSNFKWIYFNKPTWAHGILTFPNYLRYKISQKNHQTFVPMWAGQNREAEKCKNWVSDRDFLAKILRPPS